MIGNAQTVYQTQSNLVTGNSSGAPALMHVFASVDFASKAKPRQRRHLRVELHGIGTAADGCEDSPPCLRCLATRPV